MTSRSTDDNRSRKARAADDPSPNAGGPAKKRGWMFPAAIAIGLLPFVAIEISVRFLARPTAVTEGLGIDNDPVGTLTIGRPLFRLNEQTGRWEIPPERSNFFRPASFTRAKKPGARRIFVLGGSTVQGRPYATETAFSTWLKLKLETADADHEYEVINAGGVSYASYRVARILDEVLGHAPDAIVIYTGHNEFLEDRTYAPVRGMSGASVLVNRIASHWKTVGWVQRKLRRQTDIGPPNETLGNEVDTRLDHAGGLESYRRDDGWRNGVEAAFEQSLSIMVDRCETARVPLILCVPASDLVNTPPFKVAVDPTLAPEQQRKIEDAWDLVQNIETDAKKRVEQCYEILALDGHHAGASFVIGRTAFGDGSSEDAIKPLTIARDFDVCPLRATTDIENAVLKLGQREGVTLVDCRILLDVRDPRSGRRPDGIPDPEFFLDHVHPTIPGHQRLAESIADQFQRLGWIEFTAESQAAYQRAAQDHFSSLDEVYFARGQQRLEGLRRWAAGRAHLSTAEDHPALE